MFPEKLSMWSQKCSFFKFIHETILAFFLESVWKEKKKIVLKQLIE